MWDPYLEWIPDPSKEQPAAPVPFPRKPGPPKKGHYWDTQTGEWRPNDTATEDLEENTRHDSDSDDELEVQDCGPALSLGSNRKFNPGWKTILPWLLWTVGLGCSAIALNTEAENRISFVCPTGADCPGCVACGAMQCKLCLERGTSGLSGGDNKFITGCKRIHIDSVKKAREQIPRG